MKALALIEEPQHVCYRYRIAAFLPELERHGVTLDVTPVSRFLYPRLRQLWSASKFDVVILQRKLLPLWQLLILRRRARALVYDFDDAMFHRDSFAAKGVDSRRRMMSFWATVYASDEVVAGNSYLAETAARFVGAERVSLIPTCVLPAKYPLATHRSAGRAVRLVWIGQPSTLQGLHQIDTRLAAAAQRPVELELRVICSEFPRFEKIPVVPRKWSSETEAQELAQCDIGISWLPDDPWSAGKCGLKVLQYMAAGLPVVANPVAMNCELVRPGETGFLATTPDEWASAIARLASDPQLRRRLGGAGRRLVEESFHVDRRAPEFLSVLERAAGRQASDPNRTAAPSARSARLSSAARRAKFESAERGGPTW